MLVKKMIPIKFLGLMIQIVISAFLLATRSVYPSTTTTQTSFIAGCALIVAFSFIQIVFTLSGINIFNMRVHFEMCSWLSCALLFWFGFGDWPKEFIWYIWGFLSVYPFLNEFFSMISVIMHGNRMVYEKYRNQN